MQLDQQDIESSLLSKGFIEDSTHHKYFHHEIDGKRTGISTYTSHGSKNKALNDYLLGMMKKQLRLDSLFQLRDLVKCPMSRDDYIQHLRGKNIISS